MLRRLVAVLLVVCWVGMFLGTHLPVSKSVDLSHGVDKTLHYSSYAVLAFLLSAWWSLNRSWNWRAAIAVLFILAGYGIADELLQIPVNRTADIADWFADLIGAATGIAAFSVLRWLIVRFIVRPPALD